MSFPRVYPYQHPVISFKIPQSWILPTRLSVEKANPDGRFLDWKIAEVLGRRSFGAYFSADKSEDRDIDFLIKLNDKTVGFKVYTKLISDYNPQLATFNQKIRYTKSRIPIYHVIQTWYIPRICILGYIDSVANIGQITPKELKPIFSNEFLNSKDSKKAYL